MTTVETLHKDTQKALKYWEDTYNLKHPIEKLDYFMWALQWALDHINESEKNETEYHVARKLIELQKTESEDWVFRCMEPNHLYEVLQNH